ncbi:mitophagy [Branchiostoma belcheri]|nr:mitophagy [Branchiostoma belcheri]
MSGGWLEAAKTGILQSNICPVHHWADISNGAWAGPGLVELRDGRRILIVRRHALNEGDREGSDRGGESMTLSYVFGRTAEGSLVPVQSVMHHCDPERRSHLPRTGRGLIYGINREHLQICRLGYEPGSPQEQPAEPRLRYDVVRSGRTPQERQCPNLFCRFALYVPEYLQHAFGQTWTIRYLITDHKKTKPCLPSRSVPILRVLPFYLENLYEGTTFP